MRAITKADLHATGSRKIWDLGNRVLYDMCRRHPHHRRDDQIIAKVWLIGRSYAASIERRRNAKKAGDTFYETVVGPTLRKSSIDQWLAGIRRTTAPGAPSTVVVHKRLMDLFRRLTGLEKRSLASKYLHFHKPDAFFIYDSRARRAIMRLVPRLRRLPAFPAPQYDREYRDFVRRCVWLWHHIRDQFGVTMTPRQIDKLLLMVSDGERRDGGERRIR